MKLRSLICAAIGALALLQPGLAAAQAWPAKPIRLIVPFPPGGSTDIVARIVAQKLGERLGQSIVIENRGGAGGTIGTALIAKAAPDGYNLSVASTSTHVVAPGVYPKLDYDPVKDFAPVGLMAISPYLLVVNTSVPAKSLQELVALARAQPGKLNYASAGIGSTTHLAMEMLKQAAGLDIVHVPYKGNGPAGVAALGGQVQALFGSMPAVLPQAKSGKLYAIAVGTAKRSSALPNVPTVAESGYADFEVSLWLGFFAPKGTPAPVLKRLYSELTAIAMSPEMKEPFERNGADPVTTTPAELTKLMVRELDKYKKVIKAANITLK